MKMKLNIVEPYGFKHWTMGVHVVLPMGFTKPVFIGPGVWGVISGGTMRRFNSGWITWKRSWATRRTSTRLTWRSWRQVSLLRKTWKLVLVSSDTGMMLNYLLYYIYTHVYINMDTFFVGRISYFSYFWPKKYYASFFPWFAILVSTLQKKQLQLQLSGHAHWKYRPDPPLDHQSILKTGFLWRTLNVPFWNTWKNP